MKQFAFITLSICCLIPFIGKSQQYPVQVNTTLAPPYSLYLSDYSAVESASLQVLVSLLELDRTSLRVKLRLTLEGAGITLQTRPSFVPPPIVLQGGVPELLTGFDLRQYLNPDNLEFSGISRAAFIQSGRLPEGFYTLTIEVLDYNRSNLISNASMANAWIVLNDPPFINIPFNHSKPVATDPQNIMFSWTPRHTASPNAAFSTAYEFKLVEMYPGQVDPEVAIRSSNSIFTTTTTQTALNYGIIEPTLIPGKNYAFRVRAYDTEGRDLFKNDGFSETYVFQFGDKCILPTNIAAESIDPNRVRVGWEPDGIHSSFSIDFRKSGATEWYAYTNYGSGQVIPELQSSTTYEYRIQPKCGTIFGEYSDVYTIETPSEELESNSTFVCGTEPPDLDLNPNLLEQPLEYQDLIRISDWIISVEEAEAMSDGTYSGTGLARVPFFKLASVRVKFDDIKVNEDYYVIDGKVNTVYSDNSRFVVDLTEPDNSGLNDEESAGGEGGSDDNDAPDVPDAVPVVTVDGTIDSIYHNDKGEIVIENTDGTVIVQAGGATSVTDGAGNEYAVDEDGNVATVGGSAAGAGGVASGGNAGGGSLGGGDITVDVENGQFGPIKITYTESPQLQEESGESCMYTASGSFDLSMIGTGLKHTLTIPDVEISYSLNCESGTLEKATIRYEQNVTNLESQLSFLKTKLKEVELSVDAEAKLSGKVKLSASTTEDIHLSDVQGYASLNTQFDMELRNGVTGEVAFTFEGANEFNGTWDFSGLHNINLALIFGDDVLGEISDATFTNEQLSGTLRVDKAFEFTHPKINLSMNNLLFKGGVRLDTQLSLNSFLIEELSGEVVVSEMEGLKGEGKASLTYQKDGLSGDLQVDNLRSFGMNVSDLDLTIQLNKFLGFESVSGSFKASHERFDGLVTANDFRLTNEKLESLSLSGKVTFDGNELGIQQSRYNAEQNLLEVDAYYRSSDSQTVLNIKGFKIHADGTIEQGEVSGKVDSGESFGPLRVTFDIPESKGKDDEGYNIYEDVKGSVLLTLKDEKEEEADKELVIEATLSYKKHPESGEYKDVELFWEGDVDMGSVAFVNGRATEIKLMVSGEGEVSGYVKGKASLTSNVSLAEIFDSTDKAFDLVLHKGLEGEVIFNLAVGKELQGAWDLTSLTNIQGELIKSGSTIARLENGSMNKKGELSGKLNSYTATTFENEQVKLTIDKMRMGFLVSLKEGISSFRITEGSTKMKISEMKGVDGHLQGSFEFIENVGIKGAIDAGKSEVSAFGMNLTDLNLTTQLTNTLDLKSISGGVKAIHPKVKGQLDVDVFTIEEGQLTKFAGSGTLIYKGFDLDVSSLTLKNEVLEADASVVMDLSGNAQRMEIDDFRISKEGDISIGGIKGKIQKGDFVNLSFDAAFADDRFKGSFDGDVALMGLKGTLDIGSSGSDEDPFTYGYLLVAAQSSIGIPIGPTGLKLTQIGGELGFNYDANFEGNKAGTPEKGMYVAGLSVGIADLANMCEVIGNPRIKFGSQPFEMQLKGSISIPRRKPLFSGELTASYYAADNSFHGEVTSSFMIPAAKTGSMAAGDILRTESAQLSFDVGDGRWSANTSISGSLLNSLNFEGLLDLKSGEMNAESPVTGKLFGSVSYEYMAEYNKESWLADVEMKLDVGFNSTVNIELLEDGMNGAISGSVHGKGYLKVDSAIDFDVTIEGSASGEVSYNSGKGNLKSTLNMSVTSGEFNRKNTGNCCRCYIMMNRNFRKVIGLSIGFIWLYLPGVHSAALL